MLRLEGNLQQPLLDEKEKEDKKNEPNPYLYKGLSGRHLANSPVVGSRHEEAKALFMAREKDPVLKSLDSQLHYVNLYRIPPERMAEANQIARQIFAEYIKKYDKFGFTVDNIVHWLETDFLCENITTVWYPGKGSAEAWYIEPKVEIHSRLEREYHPKGSRFVEGMLPRCVVAYHELMHVEEAEKNGSAVSLEILASLRSHILVDIIHKKLNGLDINSVVDYDLFLKFAGKKIPLGEFVNFYRQLEEKLGGLAKAVLSPQSFALLAGTSIADCLSMGAEVKQVPAVPAQPKPLEQESKQSGSPLLRNSIYPPQLPQRRQTQIQEDECCEPTRFSWVKRMLGC